MSANTAGRNQDTSGLRNFRYFEGYFPQLYKQKLVTGTSYVFFTKPQLFLNPYKPSNSEAYDYLSYQNMTTDAFFSMFLNDQVLNEQDKEIIYNLSYKSNEPGYNTVKSNFIKILTNECKNFDPSDTVLDIDSSAFNTKEGFTMPLPTHTTASEGAGNLIFQFTETANMDLMKLLTLWVKYIKYINDGTFRANPDMVRNGILDYMCSIYYFLLGPDGKTIKYWCRYTGCYPTTIPYGAYSQSRGDRTIAQISCPFQYILKEDMNPQILEDFNRVSLGTFDYETVSEDRDFISVRDSDLLSYKKLVSGVFANIATSSERDPIVFLNTKSNDQSSLNDKMNDCFELSFGETDVENEFYKERFDYDFSDYKSKL